MSQRYVQQSISHHSGQAREKKRRGKGKAEGMTEGRGRKEGMGNSDGGCATAEMTYTVSSGTLNPSIPYHT